MTGRIDGLNVVDPAFKMTGTLELTDHGAVAHIDDIDLGNVPNPLLAAFRGRPRSDRRSARQGRLDHTYTVTYAKARSRSTATRRDKVENASATIVRDGATVTISPVSGPWEPRSTSRFPDAGGCHGALRPRHVERQRGRVWRR